MLVVGVTGLTLCCSTVGCCSPDSELKTSTIESDVNVTT